MMRLLHLRGVVPWLIGICVATSLACIGVTLYLGLAARTADIRKATHDLSAQTDMLARQIEGDLTLFDLAVREASNLASGQSPPRTPLLELPLTARYVGFMNVLNEVGDVIADPRSNVSRPANFAGRDYFQDHQKNPADIIMIGRPFATAPNQHASIPISRRLNRPDGGFGGVIVAGVHLAWLDDLLSHPFPGPRASITIRRDDGVILTRTPFDLDAIGRGGAADRPWLKYLRTGTSSTTEDNGGIRLFRRIGASPLVLELAVEPVDLSPGEPDWLIWLPLLTFIPALCVFGMSLLSHQLQRRGNRIAAAAHAANDENMRLLADMSHELRTPLTGILGQADLMASEGGLNDGQAARLATLTEAGALMRDIVNRVIDVARPDGRIETPLPVPCDLDPLVRTSLGMVEADSRAKGLLLTSAFEPATPRRVMLARDLVLQVLNNLLRNAVKFTTTGTVALRISGDTFHLRFEIADTGPGIPAANRHRLFHAYDRLSDTTAQNEGTGLGLSIAERFVHVMGGRIGHAENSSGGSVFWFELPITVCDPATVMTAAVILPPTAPTTRSLRLLLADDLDLTRTVTADYLRSAGHEVTAVPDGETAIAEVRNRTFDVVLTDMRMPVVDGLEVTRRIRALPGHRGRIPVVLVTADLLAITQSESGQTGVDVCLRKPFTRSELLGAVATAAKLTSTPERGDSIDPVLNEVALNELRESQGEAAFATYLGAARLRLEAMIDLLRAPDVSENPTLRQTAHELVGVTGLLGLTTLSLCLRQFDITRGGGQSADELRDATVEAVRALRRQQDPAAVSHSRVA